MAIDDYTLKHVGPIWERLYGGLWHATRMDRYEMILRSRSIDPEPAGIADTERWSTSLGPEHYPLVRHLGGVSLFDFTDFHAEEYGRNFPMSSWTTFLPFRKEIGAAVWIGIDRNAVGSKLITADDLKRLQEERCLLGHKRMPKIEFAHMGPIAITAFTEAWFVGEGYPIRKLPITPS